MYGPHQMDLARSIIEERTEAMLAERAARSLSGPGSALRERLGFSLISAGLRMIDRVETRPPKPQTNPPC